MVAAFRILALSHSARLDGAEQVFLETMAGLHLRGHAVLTVLPGRGALSQALEKAGVAVEFAPLPWWILPPGELNAGHFLAQLGPQVAALRARAKEFKAQVIHTSTSVILHGALAGALEGLPHLWQVHEMLGEPACGLDPTLGAQATWRLMAALSAPPRGRLVVASRAMHALAQGYLDATNLKGAEGALTQLPHGHDLAAYLALPLLNSAEVRAGRKAGREPIRFVVVASVTPRKGLDSLIRALAALVAGGADGHGGRALPAFEVEVIGAAHDKAYLKELQAQAKAAKVAKLIRFAGYRSDLPERLRGARAVVHASRNDPSPVGLILAMAAARPIVATRCGGPEKMLEDGVSGRLIAVDDVAALAAEMRRLVTDPAYGVAWSARARAEAQATYSLETYLDRLTALYAEMVSKGPRTGAAAAAAPQWPLDATWVPVVLDAIHRHTGSALGDVKQLTPRQQKALSGIVKSAKLLKKTLPAGLYDKLAGLW